MSSYIIFLVLFVPPLKAGPPLVMQTAAVYGSFSSDAACNTHGRKLAADLQATVPAQYRAEHRCERREVQP